VSENKFSGGDLFVAALLGAAVGAGVALLLAPKSGKETREQISEFIQKKKEMALKLPDAIKSASGAAKEALTAARPADKGAA
jgi:gas vesicle protein